MTEKDQFFFQAKEKNDPGLLAGIERLCEGLIYISETDSPVTVFTGPETEQVNAGTILRHIGGSEETPAEEGPVDMFFARLTTIKDWYGAAEMETAKKYLELKELLEVNLRELKLIRLGVTRIDIFVVGIDPNGCLAGIRTSAVET